MVQKPQPVDLSLIGIQLAFAWAKASRKHRAIILQVLAGCCSDHRPTAKMRRPGRSYGDTRYDHKMWRMLKNVPPLNLVRAWRRLCLKPSRSRPLPWVGSSAMVLGRLPLAGAWILRGPMPSLTAARAIIEEAMAVPLQPKKRPPYGRNVAAMQRRLESMTEPAAKAAALAIAKILRGDLHA